jgi:hypothetical protein
MVNKEAASATLDWLAGQRDGLYWQGPLAMNAGREWDGMTVLDGGTVLPDRAHVSMLGAVLLANGWKIRLRHGSSNSGPAALSPDGTEMPPGAAVRQILGVDESGLRLIRSGETMSARDSTESAMKAMEDFAQGITPDTINRQYRPLTARGVLEFFRAHPELHDQSLWYDVEEDADGNRPTIEPLGEADGYPCGTTMCVAGAVCHVNGFWLTGHGVQDEDGQYAGEVDDLARRMLGLTRWQASWLFDSDRTNVEVTDTLAVIADGGHPTFGT